jgi:hypothetical protein
MAKDKLPSIEVAVDCGRISTGDHTVSVPVRISRDDMTEKQAFAFLCDAQLEARIARDPAADKDVPGQQSLTIGGLITVSGTVDVRSFRATSKAFSATLSFPLSTIDDAPVGRLAMRPAQLVAKRLGQAQPPPGRRKPSADDESGDDSPDDPPGQMTLADVPDKGPAQPTHHCKDCKATDPDPRTGKSRRSWVSPDRCTKCSCADNVGSRRGAGKPKRPPASGNSKSSRGAKSTRRGKPNLKVHGVGAN